MKQTKVESGSTFGGALIIAGTCIGAGMLAMPVETGIAGFYPAVVVNLACWLFMLCTGLLFLEVTLWMPDGANLLSMAERFLGLAGKWIGGISFLFLYYCLQVAYIDGGHAAFSSMITRGFGITLGEWESYLLFTAIFASIVWMGTRVLDRINWILMVGLIVSYLLLVGVASSEVTLELLQRRKWAYALPAIPILFSAYGYHNVIPSVATYLKRDARKLKRAIIIGMLLPLAIYTIWQWMIIGTVPEQALHQVASDGLPITTTLENITHNHWVSSVGLFFGFFALVTSLLGVSLSMVDFLGDGFGIKQRIGLRRFGLILLVFVPPLLLAQAIPGLFQEALRYAGGFGEAILNGLFPVMMVWIGRYQIGLKSECQLPGGRFILALLFFLSLGVIFLQIHHMVD